MALVLVTDYAWPSLEPERAVLSPVGAEIVVAENSERSLESQTTTADAILTNWRRIPAAALEAADRCVVVARYGIGLDNIPVDVATRLGIVVTNVPDFCLDEVADHTIALLLACNRRIVAFARATARGEWSLATEAPRLRRLRGQTLGLVGYGRLGRAVAARAGALGLEVIAYSPRLTPGPIQPGVQATNDLHAMLRAADYVSLHAPATPETRHLIDAAALGEMKPTAYLINTSRGSLVDEDALADAIERGELAGAALDVLASEPPAPGTRLLELENVVTTPHAAFCSQESIADVQVRAARSVADALSGRRPGNVVNPAVLASDRCRLRTT